MAPPGAAAPHVNGTEALERWAPISEPIRPRSERVETIVSLLPSATEILFAIGAGGDVVGTTHECEPLSEGRTVCTANLLPPNLSAAEIDAAVSAQLSSDEHTIYRLDSGAVCALSPTLVVTQALCAVCAVPEDAVRASLCGVMGCRVVTADPHTLEELFSVVESVARAAGRAGGGARLVRQMRARLGRVARVRTPRKQAPGVMVLEWPAPPYAPGHWVCEMVESAGGLCVLGARGAASRRVEWGELHEIGAAHRDGSLVVVAAFCGYDLGENEREVDKIRDDAGWVELTSGAHVSVYATNATAYFSRPGPRLIDGCELLSYMLHRTAEYKPQRGCASKLVDGTWVDLCELKEAECHLGEAK